MDQAFKKLPSEEASGQVPGSVELSGASARKGVRGPLNIMDDQVPADGAEAQVAVFIVGVPNHAAGIDFTLAWPGR